MKKIILLVLILALCFWLNTPEAYYGAFRDGTGARDSVWMAVNTFDTLGQVLNADTVVWIRFYRTTLVDSTIVTGAGTRTGYYLTGKRAFDGTNYGEYTVDIRWKVQGKNFKKAESYTVFPDSVTGVGRLQTNQDKTNYQLATGQVIARADSVTGVGRLTTNLDKTGYSLASGQVIARADSVTGLGRLSTNLDKINYQLASGQVVARADSVTGVGRINTNLDKTGYGLTTAYLTKADSGSAGASYLRAKYVEDKTGYGLAGTQTFNNIGTWTGNLSGSVGSVTGGVTVTTNNDKTGYTLTGTQTGVTIPTITTLTNWDKTGYRLSSQGQVDIWIVDTTGLGSGWSQFFKGRLDANISSRGTSNLIVSDNIGINWADITNPSTVQSLIGTRIKYVDSLGEEIAGGSATNPDTIANHVWIWGTRTLTSGAGTGANQVILTIKQSSDSTPIASAQVQVLNQGQTATIGLLTTNPSGQATFALDNAIYKVRLFKPGWQFTVPESVVVSGNTSKTFYGSIFNPGSPPSPNLCRVYNWIYRAVTGQPDSGAIIQMRIKTVPLKYQNIIISGYARRDTADANGYFYLDVYPNSILTPSTMKYEVIIFKTDGTIYKDTAVTVPATNCWQLIW